MTDFLNRLKENSEEIDKFLDTHLPYGNGLSKKLFEAMRYSSISGGKKIRAFFVESFQGWGAIFYPKNY